MISDRIDINRVLMEIRALKAQARPMNGLGPKDIEAMNSNRSLQAVDESPNFGQLLDQAVGKVNELQKFSNAMRTAFEQGQKGVDIIDVMIASQKASVSFQAMVQVRNGLADAYRDVMNMPV